MRYKLIKRYPGSPPINTSVSRYKEGFRQVIASGAVVAYLEENEVEGWPEFWEKIYEIKLTKGYADHT